jgi:L-alanine-DL-glutamate epimerase-like enolase superfamily enzyme
MKQAVRELRITSVTSTILSVPFAAPTFWPYGRWDGVTVVVVEIATDAGITGIGESSCFQSPAEGFKSFIDAAGQLLIGESPFDTERLLSKLKGHGGWVFAPHFASYALGGLDMALWDIIGKAANQPLYRLLGGRFRAQAECSKYLHHDSPEAMAAEAAVAVAGGYQTLYFKYTDIPHLRTAVRAVRAAVGDEPVIWVDFNQTLSPGFAVQYLREMEPYGLNIAEQPVAAANLEGMAYVKNSVSARILAHESSWSLPDVLNVIIRDAADIISVEPRMTWGILAVKKAAAAAEAAGLPVTMHSSAELGIAQAAYLHIIASTPNFILANQCMYDWFAADIISGGKLKFDGPLLTVPEGPGIGVELDREAVARFHANYRKVGTYAITGSGRQDGAADGGSKVPVPKWPAY